MTQSDLFDAAESRRRKAHCTAPINLTFCQRSP